MKDDDAPQTNPLTAIDYEVEERWGDARFDPEDVLQISNLTDEIVIEITFENARSVVLGRPKPPAKKEPTYSREETDRTITTISDEFRQQLLELAAAKRNIQAQLSTQRDADESTVLDLKPFGVDLNGVSRSHALLAKHNRYVTLTDLHSTNGTRLNGSLLTPMQHRIIRNGDEFQLGNLQLRVRFVRMTKDKS